MIESPQNKKYFPELDIIKGIAILLVIYGHSFCNFPINIRDMFPINAHDAVTSFHMQLFFIASGILFSAKGTWKDFFMKKTARILVPFVAFCCFDTLLRFLAEPFTRSKMHENLLLVIINGTHYWFLHTLFLMYIIAKLTNGNKIMCSIFILVSIGLTFLLPDGRWKSILGIGHIIYFSSWFFAGYLSRNLYSTIFPLLQKWWVILILGIISANCLLWLNIYFFISSYLYPLLCSVIVWSLSLFLLNARILKNGCSYFGRYSLQYYLNHNLYR